MCTCFMALRVLLADESTTIKKVMQLALQDFGVEVKAVPVGLDVLQVAQSFHPDIIFTDVLLQKKNGYEVSAELKADPTLKHIPIVLMWSGFMELDEAKAKMSKANRRLEKPFDAEALRSLVKELVPSTSSNAISQFLTFPDLPPMIEDGKRAPAEDPENIELVSLNPRSKNSASKEPKKQAPQTQDFEEPEEFQSVPLPKEFRQDFARKNSALPARPATDKPTAVSENSDSWTHQDLSRFRIELPKDEDFSSPDEDFTNTSIVLSSSLDEISLDEIDSPRPRPKKNTPPVSQSTQSRVTSKTFGDYTGTNLNMPAPSQIEDAIRQEARATIEAIAWKILPEIVERVVREELQKLLKDTERL